MDELNLLEGVVDNSHAQATIKRVYECLSSFGCSTGYPHQDPQTQWSGDRLRCMCQQWV